MRAGRGRRGLLQSNAWFYTTSATCEDKYNYTKTSIGCADGQPPQSVGTTLVQRLLCCHICHRVHHVQGCETTTSDAAD
jgi:hypothetical protein